MGHYAERFASSATRFAERTAIEVQRRQQLESWTYDQLAELMRASAAYLRARGLRPGDRCAILGENDARWCACELGILALGAVVVPLDTSYSAEQVAILLDDAGVGLLLVSEAQKEKAERACLGLARSVAIHDVNVVTDGAVPDDFVIHDTRADDTALILYTSGTTSDPKGVVLTHANLLAEIDSALPVVNFDQNDAVLGVLPLFHALAQVANLLIPLSIGARVVFLETLNSTELLRVLQERKITAFACVPQIFYLIHERIFDQVARAGRFQRVAFKAMLAVAGMLRETFGLNVGPTLFRRVHDGLGPSVRVLVTGGSQFDERIGRDFFRMGFNILQAYGLTETSGAATVLRPGDKHITSAGHPLPGVEIKIVRSSVADAALQEGQDENARVGEVAIRGPVVMPGYYRRPDVNAQCFDDGWFLSGDLGYLDSSGRLYITGRAKEVIVLASGKNIYPEEIESYYLESPFIKELCVMGRSRADSPAADRLHAVVVPD